MLMTKESEKVFWVGKIDICERFDKFRQDVLQILNRISLMICQKYFYLHENVTILEVGGKFWLQVCFFLVRCS